MTTAPQNKRREEAPDRKGTMPCRAQQPGETHPEVFRQRSFSTFHPSARPTASSNKNPRQRWSTDCGGDRASPAVVVRKSKVRPAPPLRGVSLPPSSSSKRHSCPVIPHPVHTRTSPRLPLTPRLSLLIPPTVQDAKGYVPGPDGPTSAPTSRPTSAPGPRGSRRCHSDTAAFRCGSTGAPLPAVTLEELRATRLRPTDPGLDGSDSVFAAEETGEDGREEEEPETAPPRPKVPPPVPAKSDYSKWLAHLVTRSLSLSDPIQSSGPAHDVTQGCPVYTQVKKKTEAVYSA